MGLCGDRRGGHLGSERPGHAGHLRRHDVGVGAPPTRRGPVRGARPERGHPHRSGHPAGGAGRSPSRAGGAPTPSWSCPGVGPCWPPAAPPSSPSTPPPGPVGTPLDLGAGRTPSSGMALIPASPTLYALVAGGVIPVDTANATAGAADPDRAVRLVGLLAPRHRRHRRTGAPSTWSGRAAPTSAAGCCPIATATGATRSPAGFDQYGIVRSGRPGRPPRRQRAVGGGLRQQLGQPGARGLLRRPAAAGAAPGPGGRTGVGDRSTRPTSCSARTDSAPSSWTGFNTVLPYRPAHPRRSAEPIPVCSGASSMAVAPAP